MVDQKEKDQEQTGMDKPVEHENLLTYDEKVFKKIAGYAASEVPGILAMSGNLIAGITDRFKGADDPTKGISVEVGSKQVAIDMKVMCEFGRNIPDIFESIVEKVNSAVKDMTGFDVVEVNVHVADVLLEDEFERKKKLDGKTETNKETD